jgi:hypothetical protein
MTFRQLIRIKVSEVNTAVLTFFYVSYENILKHSGYRLQSRCSFNVDLLTLKSISS